MEKSETFAAIFAQLQPILAAYAPQMRVLHDEPGNYHLLGAPTAKYPDGMFFGTVSIKKNYVSYHLMAVYFNPPLLAGISDALRKRMGGKTCFNFATLNEPLFAELAEVTERAFACYVQQGWVLSPSTSSQSNIWTLQQH